MHPQLCDASLHQLCTDKYVFLDRNDDIFANGGFHAVTKLLERWWVAQIVGRGRQNAELLGMYFSPSELLLTEVLTTCC